MLIMFLFGLKKQETHLFHHNQQSFQKKILYLGHLVEKRRNSFTNDHLQRSQTDQIFEDKKKHKKATFAVLFYGEFRNI